MEAEGGDPSVTARGVAGAVHTDSAAAQIEAMRKGLALNRFKAGVAADDGETVPAEPMSQTQLNKLCKASRLKRYTQKKKNRCGLVFQSRDVEQSSPPTPFCPFQVHFRHRCFDWSSTVPGILRESHWFAPLYMLGGTSPHSTTSGGRTSGSRTPLPCATTTTANHRHTVTNQGIARSNQR